MLFISQFKFERRLTGLVVVQQQQQETKLL